MNGANVASPSTVGAYAVVMVRHNGERVEELAGVSLAHATEQAGRLNAMNPADSGIASIEVTGPAARSARIPSNVEASGFRRGEYVGYDCVASPGVWRIVRREGGGWRAYHDRKPGAGYVYGRTLAEVGAKLADPVTLARAFGAVGV